MSNQIRLPMWLVAAGLLLGLITCSGATAAGYVAGLTNQTTSTVVDDTPVPNATPYSNTTTFAPNDMELFWEALDIVETYYDGSLPAKTDISHNTVRGMLFALDDPYALFSTPEQAALFHEDMSGSFEGIGAYVDLNEDGLFEIVRPMDGQPADIAGLLAGDIVTAVDGEVIIGQSMDDILSRVRGPKGSRVTLTIIREGVPDPFDITIVREKIETPIVTTEYLTQTNVSYIRLADFSMNADVQLEEAISEALDTESVGIILDVRDNPGGFLQTATSIADLFLAEGVIVTQRDSQGAEEVYTASAGDVGETVPFVILVNEGSASASEVIAGAFQDTGRAQVIGAPTFGKGSVQRVFPLSDGSQMQFTVARWYTPKSNSIQGNGITPDILVDTPSEFNTELDTQRERAITYLLTGE